MKVKFVWNFSKTMKRSICLCLSLILFDDSSSIKKVFFVGKNKTKFVNFSRNLDDGLAEAISTVIWAAPRIQTDVQELKVIADILTTKYGRQYTDACREEAVQSISEKLKHKMSIQIPAKLLVEKYLIEIAKNYNLEYEPDPQVMAEGQDALLIDVGSSGGNLPNNLDLASGGAPQPLGFIGFPQPPLLPDSSSNLNVMVAN